jgi:hypothetical protein
MLEPNGSFKRLFHLRNMSAWASGSSSCSSAGEVLDEARAESCFLLNFVCNIVQVSAAGCQGPDLLDGCIFLPRSTHPGLFYDSRHKYIGLDKVL